MNSISLYSLKSKEANNITDGTYKFYIKGNDLIINDGDNETVIDTSTISSFNPSTTLFPSPSFESTEIVELNQTLQQCLNNIFNSVMTIAYYNAHKNELKGEPGIDGKDGMNGIDGLSAFEHYQYLNYDDVIADNNIPPELQEEYNRRLNEYKLSIKGDKGDRGSTGPQGPRGPKGADGHDGLDGKDGEDGKVALSWIWDLINSGVSVASFTALQTQVSAINAALALLQTQVAGLLGASGVDAIDTSIGAFRATIDSIDEFSEVADAANTIARNTDGIVHRISHAFRSGINRIRGYNAIPTIPVEL